MWLIFLAIHLVGSTGFSLILRKSLVQKVDRWTLATVMQIGITVPLLFAMIFSHPDWSAYNLHNILQIILIALLVIGFHWTQVKALQHLEVSVFTVLYNLRIVFATLIGILIFREQVMPLQILGGLLIFLAVITTRQKGRKDLTSKGIQWGIRAAIAISVLNLFEKDLIDRVGYMTYAVPVMTLATVLMLGVMVLKKQKIPFKYFKEPQTVGLMSFRAASAYGFGLAFSHGGALSVSHYISSLSVILTVALGAIWLGERDYLRQKIYATGLAVAGLTVILIANLTK